VITDQLPVTSKMIYMTGSATDGGLYDPATNTLTWVLPSIPPGADVQLTYQIQASLTSAQVNNNRLENNARLSYAGGEVTAFHVVTVTGPYLVRLAVYNSAGELVKVLATFNLGTAISGFTVENPDITTDSQKAEFFWGHVSLGTWDATTSTGQKVTNGTYYIKIDNIDTYGATTTVTHQVTVFIGRNTIQIAVYNEAGEVVKHFTQAEVQNLVAGEAGTLQMEDFDLTGAVISTDTLFIPGGIPLDSNPGVNITLGSGRSFNWDGRGDNGIYLKSGSYYVVISSDMENQPDQQIVKMIHVRNNGEENIEAVVLAPNPVFLSQTQKALFFVRSATRKTTGVEIRIYTVAGELIKTLVSDPSNPLQVTWDLAHSNIASGTYIGVVFLKFQDHVIGRKILKVQIVH
jgi:flagellar hook assembly protein FlgD